MSLKHEPSSEPSGLTPHTETESFYSTRWSSRVSFPPNLEGCVTKFLNPEPQNSKPRTKNSKPQTLNPTPESRPVLVRLAWHSSGTYDAKTKTGAPLPEHYRARSEQLNRVETLWPVGIDLLQGPMVQGGGNGTYDAETKTGAHAPPHGHRRATGVGLLQRVLGGAGEAPQELRPRRVRFSTLRPQPSTLNPQPYPETSIFLLKTRFRAEWLK